MPRCKECGAEFATDKRAPHKKYCSADCRLRAANRRHNPLRDKDGPLKIKSPDIFKGTLAEFRKREGLPPIEESIRPCTCCGRPFKSTGRFNRLCKSCSTHVAGGIDAAMDTGHSIQKGAVCA